MKRTNQLPYSGGGAYHSTLNNCIVYSNRSANGANYTGPEVGLASVLNYCCTTPMGMNEEPRKK